MSATDRSAPGSLLRAIWHVRIGRCGPVSRRLARSLRWALPVRGVNYFASRILGTPTSAMKPMPAAVNVDGVDFDLDLRDSLHRYVYLDLFDVELRRVVVPLFRPGDLVVDVGANFGFWALAAANNGCRVIAIEPILSTRQLLVANAFRNGLQGKIEIVSDAISDSVGELTVMIPDGETGLASAHPGSATVMEQFTVPATTLDNLVGDRHIRLLKIDVEGHELSVLLGAQQILSNGSVDYVMIEIVSEHLVRAGSSVADVCTFLTDNGFELVRWVPANDGLFPKRRRPLPSMSEIGIRQVGDALWRWRESTATRTTRSAS